MTRSFLNFHDSQVDLSIKDQIVLVDRGNGIIAKGSIYITMKRRTTVKPLGERDRGLPFDQHPEVAG